MGFRYHTKSGWFLILVAFFVSCASKSRTPGHPASTAAAPSAVSPTPIGAGLESRVATVRCAIVRIQHKSGQGTGFFIDSSGTLVTAAHVVFDRALYLDEKTGLPGMRVTPKGELQIRLDDGSIQKTAINATSGDAARAVADVAVLKTGITPPCHLPVGDASALKIGQHLISMGHPASSGDLALFDGFLSSRHPHLQIPIGQIDGKPVYPNYEVLRVQMPITAGASGSPVVTDDGVVVGIISELPRLWTEDLESLIALMARRSGSGVTLSGFDTVKLLAQLAWIVRDFESPGSALAVPISYLKLPSGTTPPPKPANRE